MEELTAKFDKEISLNHELTTEHQAEGDDQPPCKISRRKERHEVKPLPYAPAMEPFETG